MPRICTKCGGPISRTNKTGYCEKCRDRTGPNNPFFGKKHTDEVKQNLKQKCAEASARNWEDPEYRKRVISGVSKPRRESFKKEQSDRIKQWYQDHPEQRDLRRKHMAKTWADGRIVPNHFSCNKSKLQNKLFQEVKALFPEATDDATLHGEDGRWIRPDILIPQFGLVIEFNGNFWHANPKFYKPTDVINGCTAKEIWEHDEDREARLGRVRSSHAGMLKEYEVLTVWEDDFKHDHDGVISRLNELRVYYDWEF